MTNKDRRILTKAFREGVPQILDLDGNLVFGQGALR